MLNNRPTNIQTGYLYSTDGKKFDVSVVLNFPTAAEYETASLDDFPETNFVGFYFGESNDCYTENCIDRFVENQNKLNKLLEKLYSLKALCPDDSEINEQIEFVKTLIVKIH